MPIVPREAFDRAHELSGNAWKVVTQLFRHRNIVTGKCNPSHKTISLNSGVEITGVSVAKRELKGELKEGNKVTSPWIETRGKRDVVLLVGVEELEEARASYLLKIQISEALKFGKPQDVKKLIAAFLGKSQDAKGDLGISPAASWDFPKTLRNSSEIENAAAAAATAAIDPNAWKQEPVTTQFLEELATRGLFSREIVQQSWQELAFAVSQRGPDARATRGELMAFCRAKQKTGILPGTGGPYVPRKLSDAAAPAASTSPTTTEKCDSSCQLCYGGQMEIVEGRARPCSNRKVAR